MKVGLGTAAIGRPQYINIRQSNASDFSLDTFREKGKSILDYAYENGVRYFDTAPGYGMAEDLLIEWVNGKNDENIEVATKWGYTYVANFDPNAKTHEIKEHSLEKLNEQWTQSEKLLPYLTTYQIHSATLDTGVLENEKVLHRLAELKSRHNLIIGLSVSGDNQVEVIKKALEVEVGGQLLFDAYQVTYNILDQSLLSILDKLKSGDKRIIIKEALANGRIFPNTNYGHYSALYKTLQIFSKKYGVGIDALALRFCVETVRPYKVLSGASEKEHASQNLMAGKFEFEKADLEKLKSFSISSKEYWAERKKLGWN